eukprot:scaffold622542_cov53-Prasinocladus_malaysianus.AAC.1
MNLFSRADHKDFSTAVMIEVTCMLLDMLPEDGNSERSIAFDNREGFCLGFQLTSEYRLACAPCNASP